MTKAQDHELQFLKDESAIRNIIHRFARGLDRCDRAIISSCFHDNATDDHGMFKGTAVEFCDWVMIELAKFERTQHHISNILVLTDGDTARSESYFLAYRSTSDSGGATSSIAAGRYLDSFERRKGDWKIAHRQAIYDWGWIGPASDLWTDPATADLLSRGLRSSEDPSYPHLAIGEAHGQKRRK